MEESSSLDNIFPFKDVKSSIDPILNYDKGKSGKVLIIDNGKCAIMFVQILEFSVPYSHYVSFSFF